jgi:DNA polymerase I
VAKSETINQSPERYAKEIESGKKVRRASLEVAIRMQPKPRLGEKVIYFITPAAVKKAPDWQQARPIEAYNPQTLPYDSAYYLKKIDEWEKRYGVFSNL